MLSQNFDEIFKRIVPGGKTELKLVKADAQDTQRSNPTQMPDATQAFTLNDLKYRGIKSRVSFTAQDFTEDASLH